jgi:thiol-disulfide isomerase/thioredoxin
MAFFRQRRAWSRCYRNRSAGQPHMRLSSPINVLFDSKAAGGRGTETLRLPPILVDPFRRCIMIRFITLCVVAGSLTTGAVASEELLTHGSPAPKFEAPMFIRGQVLARLSPGTVFVIEFSGTQCVPCLKAIPHLEDLQRTYKEVVFLSVFSEPEDDVRRYLDGRGKGITLRVVCDPDHAPQKAWSVAAAQVGIPHVFVVNGAGKIAWIGHPGKLNEPLARVVAGKPIGAVDPVEEMRWRIQTRAEQLREQISERERRAEEENRTRVTRLIQQGELEKAIQVLDQLITKYHDLPSNVETFRARKLLLLGRVRGRGKEAFSLAFELAVDARLNHRQTVAAAANSIMNHYVRCLPANRDERMLQLALALLGDATIPGEKSVRSLSDRSSYFQALSRANDLRGDRAGAATALRQAITAEEKLYEQFRSEKYSEKDLNDQKHRITKLREDLTKYGRE